MFPSPFFVYERSEKLTKSDDKKIVGKLWHGDALMAYDITF